MLEAVESLVACIRFTEEVELALPTKDVESLIVVDDAEVVPLDLGK